ncbi:MAG: hypothetical protein R3A78_03445 [Polyangiales bacterium]|nr:hypothetical protein [Myxococcales bacterium]
MTRPSGPVRASRFLPVVAAFVALGSCSVSTPVDGELVRLDHALDGKILVLEYRELDAEELDGGADLDAGVEPTGLGNEFAWHVAEVRRVGVGHGAFRIEFFDSSVHVLIRAWVDVDGSSGLGSLLGDADVVAFSETETLPRQLRVAAPDRNDVVRMTTATAECTSCDCTQSPSLVSMILDNDVDVVR